MISFKKYPAAVFAALLMALSLSAGAYAEEAAATATTAPAAKPAAKAKTKKAKAKKAAAAKPQAQQETKPAAKAPAPLSSKSDAKAAAAPVKQTKKEQAKKDQAKEAQPETVQEEQKEVHPANVGVVRVNGAIITKQDLDRAVKVMMAQSQVQEPLSPEIQKQAEAAALEQLTSAELLYQEGSKLEIADLDKQVEEKVAKNRAKFGTENEFVEALKDIDMTIRDMQDFTRKDIVINNFIEQRFTAKAAATEAEAKKFYEDNKKEYFTKEESVKASHILVAADAKATAAERKKAKEKAEALLKRVKGGEDFAAVAKAESSCPSASQGGDLGAFGRGQMVPPFEKAAFGLKAGEVSGVVETEFGYHIIKVVEKQEAGPEKFETVKEKITDFLKRQKVQQELSAYIDDLRKNAKIEKM